MSGRGYLRAVFRALAYPIGAVWRRRWLRALLLACLVLAGAASVYGYARYQWRAAHAALAADRTAEAVDRLAFCLRVWPWSPEVRLWAARAARINGDMEAAEAHLHRCLKLNGGASEAVQLEFLLLRVQAGELDELAPALIDSVEKDHPESPIILETLARAYMRRLLYRPAHACLTRWTEIAPDTAKPYILRGWVHERLNLTRPAMADYQRALELDPELSLVRLRVAEMFLEDNRPLEAVPHLERLRAAYPNRAPRIQGRSAPDAQVQARLGQCRLLQGRHEEARGLLEAAVEEMPRDLPLLIHMAKLELAERRPAEAERWLRRALEVDPIDPEALYTMVSALQLLGRRQEAAATLEQYKKHKATIERTNRLLKQEAEQPTKDPGGPSELGGLLLASGREGVGVYWLNQALERDPDHQPTHRALVEYYEKKGEQEKAAAHRRRLHEAGKGTQ